MDERKHLINSSRLPPQIISWLYVTELRLEVHWRILFVGLFRIKTEYLFKPFDFSVVLLHKSRVLQRLWGKNGGSRYKASSCTPLSLFGISYI